MIFDLHNDLVTYDIKRECKTQFLSDLDEHKTVITLWTTKVSEPINFIATTVEQYKKFMLPFGIEDLHFINLDNISSILDIGIFYCSLTWNDENALAGGALADKNCGLSNLGIDILTHLNKNKIVIDTAHLNKKSFYDVYDKAEILMNTHTCLSEIYEHPRNIDNNQVDLIVKKKGLIGLTIVSDFIGKAQVSIQDYFKQIDSIAQKYGTNNVAIGTDFFGTNPNVGLDTYDNINLNLKNILTKHGYLDSDIANIFYNNANNFYNNILRRRQE